MANVPADNIKIIGSTVAHPIIIQVAKNETNLKRAFGLGCRARSQILDSNVPAILETNTLYLM